MLRVFSLLRELPSPCSLIKNMCLRVYCLDRTANFGNGDQQEEISVTIEEESIGVFVNPALQLIGDETFYVNKL